MVSVQSLIQSTDVICLLASTSPSVKRVGIAVF